MNEFPATPTAELSATFRCANGRTHLADLYNKAPLKIAKTFALESALGVCVMDASPGLLAGDFYNFDWNLQEKARVHISTQGFTRVHPSRERPCLLRQNIQVENGALLEYFPEPLMLYKDAALRSECAINIQRGGTLLFSEIVCVGRIGCGEEFEFHSLRNRLRVCYDDEWIFINHSSLDPFSFRPQRVGAWKKFTHQSNLYIFSTSADKMLCDALREVLEQSSDSTVWGGATLLERCGISVSLLGRRACDLQDVASQLRDTARNFLAEKIPKMDESLLS